MHNQGEMGGRNGGGLVRYEGVDCSHGVRRMLKPAGLLYKLL
jgi:hypothetical protein